MRAHVERSFNTTRTQLLPNFTGQTFANIQDKGDYDPKANASLFVDELARALVLYEVDVYHNSPHEGLLGETPRAAWQRLMLQGAGFSRVTPGAHRQRATFGIPLTRTLSKRGIRVMGLHYQSQALAAVLARDGNVPLAVRVDPEDLGWISFRDRPGLETRPLRDRRLRRRFDRSLAGRRHRSATSSCDHRGGKPSNCGRGPS